MPKLTQEQRSQIDAQILANIVKKAGAGKTLTSREVEFLDDIASHEADTNLGEWDTTTLAQVIGMTPQSVNEQVRAGRIPKIGRGRFDPVAAVSAYCEYLREARDDAKGSGKSLTAARTELALEDARLKRIQAEKLEGRFADVQELIAAESHMLEGIAGIIRSSPLSDERKEDIFTALQDHAKKWKEEHEQ